MKNDEVNDERTPEDLRKRLVEIDDEVRLLDANQFASKHALRSEADDLRTQLSDMTAGETESIKQKWAERAGRKAVHTVDDGLEEAKAAIISPDESPI